MGVATHLKIIQQPAGFAFGSSCDTPAIVGAYDDTETLVTDFDGRCTVVGLASTLSGPTKLIFYNGKATFRRLAARTLGALTLAFSCTGLTGVNAASVTVTAAIGTFRGVCELPRVVPVQVYPSAPIVQSVSGAALQAALNIAAARDAASGGAVDRTFVVSDGAMPPYYVPNRPADATGIISIEGSSAPCAIGTRATLAMMGARAVAESSDTTPPIYTATSAGGLVPHHYRFAFHTARVTAGVDSATYFTLLLGTAGPDQDSLAKEPHHMYFDRFVADGGDGDIQHVLGANCRYLCATDSSFLNGHHRSADGNAIACWNGSGQHYFGNCDLQGSGEGYIYGGSDPSIAELIPSDITFDRCTNSRPLTWDRNVYPDTGWEVKNNVDLKNVQRLRQVGNLVENSWVDGQGGALYNIKSVNQEDSAPWSGTSDVVIELCAHRNAVALLALAGNPEGKECAPLSRIWISHCADWNAPNNITIGGDETFDVTIDHVTYFGGAASSGCTLYAGNNDPFQQQQHRFRYTNNIGTQGSNGPLAAQENFPPEIFQPGGALGDITAFTKNAFGNVAGGWSGTNANFPAGNYLDDVTTESIGFTSIDETAWDSGDPAIMLARLALAAGSPYKAAGTDGLDLGADMTALAAALSGTYTPPSLAATSLSVLTQPVGGVVGAPLATQPVFRELDQFGAAFGATGSVTVVRNIVSGGVGSVLGGTTTKPFSGSDAAFTNLSLDVPGGYTLTATDEYGHSATTGLITVSLPATTSAPSAPDAMSIIQNSTSPILFYMSDSTDSTGRTPKTGLSPTVTLSKAGSAFAGAAGTVAEISGGWYKLTPASADTATLGDLGIHASAAGADDWNDLRRVVTAVRTDLAPELADIVANLDTPVSTRGSASVQTTVAANIATLLAAMGTLTTAERAAISDAISARHYRGGSNASPTNAEVHASGLMDFLIAAAVLTIKHSDGTTALTRTLTRDATLGAITGAS